MPETNPQTNPMPPDLPQPTPATQSPQPPHQPGGQTPAQQNSPNAADILGIISLVMVTLGLFLVGLILGIVGDKKAKKMGVSPTLPRLGWIINLIFSAIIVLVILLVIAAAPAIQRATRDTTRRTDTQKYHAELEYYFNSNGFYPKSLDKLPGSANVSHTVDGDIKYHPSPDGCDMCKSYILQTQLNKATPGGSKLYELKSLNGQPKSLNTTTI